MVDSKIIKKDRREIRFEEGRLDQKRWPLVTR